MAITTKPITIGHFFQLGLKAKEMVPSIASVAAQHVLPLSAKPTNHAAMCM